MANVQKAITGKQMAYNSHHQY